MQTQYVTCPNCLSQNPGHNGMCSNCGTVLPAPMPMQQVGQPFGPPAGADKKVLAGVLGIVLGGLGIHKFVLGYQTEGIIMLLVSLVGGFFLWSKGDFAIENTSGRTSPTEHELYGILMTASYKL